MKTTMQNSNLTFPIFLALLAATSVATSQDPVRSGIYQIQSGSYREVGGIWGVFNYPLPGSYEAFVSLAVPETGPAELKFLDNKQRDVFPRLTNGIVSENMIRFQYQTVNPFVPALPAQVDYTITNAAGRLWISGSITSSPVCCDIPYRFEHHDVSATFIPVLTLGVAGEIELRWSSASNQNYQVQWASDFAQSAWTNLGEVLQGNGTTNHAIDAAVAVPSRRFYRVLALP